MKYASIAMMSFTVTIVFLMGFITPDSSYSWPAAFAAGAILWLGVIGYIVAGERSAFIAFTIAAIICPLIIVWTIK